MAVNRHIGARILRTSAGLLAAGALAGAGLPAHAQDAPDQPRDPRCHTSQLTGSMSPVDAGAGQRYANVSLTNTSDRFCTISGTIVGPETNPTEVYGTLVLGAGDPWPQIGDDLPVLYKPQKAATSWRFGVMPEQGPGPL